MPHICICVCTFKRPQLLRGTLEKLRRLATEAFFDYSIVVADNDRAESARATVAEVSRNSKIEIVYCVEPEQNISLARNKALQFAKGDFVAWIDDDECPDKNWLLSLFKALQSSGADGVLGPVKPVFEQTPPAWIVKGRFFEKGRHADGDKLPWHLTSTANALVRRNILNGLVEPFRRQFGSGCEDVDFFKRQIERGRVFIWCTDAAVSEVIQPARWTQRYLFRRAWLRGQNNRHFANAHGIAKSLVAVPLYFILLPFLLVAGQHLFVKVLMKLGDHAGKLSGVAGLKLMGEKYVSG
jgi:succinoglycan biosynthesis protein ExoM